MPTSLLPRMRSLALAAAFLPTCLSYSSPAIAGKLADFQREQTSPLQELERVTSTRISLVKPDGYSPASTFTGFTNVETGCSLMVVEIAGPYAQVSAGFEPKMLKKQGMLIMSREPRAMEKHPGELLQIKQKVQGLEVRKWVWVFGDKNRCGMVIGICPEELVDSEFTALGAAVRTAIWSPELAIDPLEGLSYEIADNQGMQLLHVLSGALSFSSDGVIDKDGLTGKPLFVVAPSVRETPGDGLKYAKQRLLQYPGHKSIKLGTFEAIQIDNLSGYACLATGVHKKSAREEFIYQVMLFEGACYWLFMGTAPERDRQEYLPIFQRMTKSFRRKRHMLRSSDGITEAEVPASWTLRAGLNDAAELQAGHPTAGNYLILLSEQKSDFPEGFSLEQFASAIAQNLADISSSRTTPVPLELHGKRAIRTQYTIENEGFNLLYVQVAVEGSHSFHQLLAWCLESQQEHGLPDINQVISSFREL